VEKRKKSIPAAFAVVIKIFVTNKSEEIPVKICINFCECIYRVSQEECARLREGVPYVKVYRYNPKHVCPKLNGSGDNRSTLDIGVLGYIGVL
jgi:hypothetical protein